MEMVLRMEDVVDMDDDHFYALCQNNPDMRLERNADGDVVIMPPTGGDTSRRNAEIIVQLGVWARRDGSGVLFDSSGGFRLPNGTVRSPDAAWVEKGRLEGLSAEERRHFLPLCPDFVVELRSESDSLYAVQEKMREYAACGARLGWLIDPSELRVEVYRLEQPVEVLAGMSAVSGEPVLPKFALELDNIWAE
jgi:Uma2 family endonuclease